MATQQNPFDEFDEPSPSLPGPIARPIAAAASNPFDEFDDTPEPSKGIVLPSIKRAGGQIVESLGTTIQDVTGPNVVTRGLRDFGGGVVRDNPSQIQSFGDVLDKPWTTVKEAVAEQLPQLGAAFAGARVGALGGGALGSVVPGVGTAAGAVVGGVVGGLAPIFVGEYGEIRNKQEETGEENIPLALAGATGATALERLGLEKIARKAGTKGVAEALGAVPEGASRLAHAGKQALKTALVEGPGTEIPQTAIERFAGGQEIDTPEAFDEYAVAGAKGAAGGGAIGGGLGLIAPRTILPAPATGDAPQADAGVTPGAGPPPNPPPQSRGGQETGLPSAPSAPSVAPPTPSVAPQDADPEVRLADLDPEQRRHMLAIRGQGPLTVAAVAGGLPASANRSAPAGPSRRSRAPLSPLGAQEAERARADIAAEQVRTAEIASRGPLGRAVARGAESGSLPGAVAFSAPPSMATGPAVAENQPPDHLAAAGKMVSPVAQDPATPPASASAVGAIAGEGQAQAGRITPEQDEKYLAEYQTLSAKAKGLFGEWASGAAAGLQRVRDAAKRLWDGENVSDDETAALLNEMYVHGESLRNDLRKHADKDGFITVYRGLRGGKHEAGRHSLESFTESAWVAKNFSDTGTAEKIRVHVDDVVARQSGQEAESEILVRKPKAGAKGPAEAVDAGPQLKYSGVHDDGEKWTASYEVMKRAEGSFTLVRVFEDVDGRREEHLTTEGEWKKGRPSKITLHLRGAAEIGTGGPESFPSEEWARKAAEDDATGMGGSAPPRASAPADIDALAPYGLNAPRTEAAARKFATGLGARFPDERFEVVPHAKAPKRFAVQHVPTSTNPEGSLNETLSPPRQEPRQPEGRGRDGALPAVAEPGQGPDGQAQEGLESQGTADGIEGRAPAALDLPEPSPGLDRAADQAATSPKNHLPEPTDLQKEAGNYQKGHVRYGGLDISIENPRGSKRSGVGEDGKRWESDVPAHYGYVRRTDGADGEQQDVYLASDREDTPAFVIDQFDPKTGRFDEHKTVLGAASQQEAKAVYDAGFSDGSGPARRKATTELPIDEFKTWLKEGDTTEPLAFRKTVERAAVANRAYEAKQAAKKAAAAVTPDASATPTTPTDTPPLPASVSPGASQEVDLSPEKLESAPPRRGEEADEDINRIFDRETPQGDRGAERADKRRQVGAAPEAGPEAPTVSGGEGTPTTATTPKGQAVDLRYALVEAADLVVSHDLEGKANPAYPKSLQPRDRSRQASTLQIQRIAGNLAPERLGASPTVSEGAPIVGPDNAIESGNGRVLALWKVYASGKEQAYRTYLRENAEKFGTVRGRVDAMKAPVLVRTRTTDMSDAERAAFARDANESTTARMSPAEEARADAARIGTALEDYLPSDDGNVLAMQNRGFVKRFIAGLAPEEAAALTTADGAPTKQLGDRIRAAVFYSAYRDERLLSLFAEEADPEIRNVIAALNLAAPEFARARSLSDTLGPYNVIPAIVEAAEIIRQARSSNQAVEEAVAQQGLFGAQDPNAQAIALFLDGNKRSAKRLGEGLRAMAGFIEGELRKAGNLALFAETPPTLGEVIARVNQYIAERYGQENAIHQDLFSQPERRAPVAQPRAEGGKPEEGDRAGAEAAEEAKAGVTPAAKTPTQPEKPAYGAANKVFTADAAAAARERLRKKLGTVRIGLDPEMYQDGITLAGFHIEAGARKFADFSKAMIADLGEKARPYLRAWFKAVKDNQGFDFGAAAAQAPQAPTEAEVDAQLAKDSAALEAERDRPGRIEHMVVEKAKRELAARRIDQAAYDRVIKTYGAAASQYAKSKPAGAEPPQKPPATPPPAAKTPAPKTPPPTKPAEPAAKPPKPIDDVGEKIGGARKDLWRERGLRLADLEGMSGGEEAQYVTKENVWPAIDYPKLIADGATPHAAALIKIIRDRLAKTPNKDTPEGRRHYVEVIGIAREEMEKAKTTEEVKDVGNKVFTRIGWYSKEGGGGWRNDEVRAKAFSVYQGRSNPFSVEWKDTRKADKMIAEGWPATKKAKTKTQAAREEGKLPERPHLDDVQRTGEDRRQGRDVTGEDFLKEFGFRGVEHGLWAAQDERQKALNLAYEALHDLAGTLGIPPKALSLNGTLGLAFGARGSGQFAAHYEPGKLVINLTKLRGAGTLAHEWGHGLDHYFGELDRPDAYQGGARGATGWMGKGRRVKRENLRPEMAATFDGVMKAIFEREVDQAEAVRQQELRLENLQGEIAKGEQRVTKAEQAEHPDKDWLKRMRAWLDDARRSERNAKATLAELRHEPRRLGGYGKVASSYFKEASKLAGTGDYWTRPTELFARAFEAYVFDRIGEQGQVSQYLVQGVEPERYGSSDYKGNPYPVGLERDAINAAFDKLFAAMQTRETEKGTALYSRSPEPSFGQAEGLFEKADVEISRITGAEISDVKATWALRAAVKSYAKRLRNRVFRNRDTGWTLKIGKDGYRKLYAGGQSAAELKAVSALPELLERAVLADSHTDRKGEPQVQAVHRLYAPLAIGDQLYRVKLTVKEHFDEARRYHALEAVEIETPAVNAPDVRSEDQLTHGRPAGASTLSVTETEKPAITSPRRDPEGSEVQRAPSGLDPAVIKPATTTQMSGAHERPAGSALSIADLLRGAVRDSDGRPFTAEDAGARYSYLGEHGAKTPKLALAAAREFAAQGIPMEEIRKTTGWFKGKDGQWRFEISDEASTFRPGYRKAKTVGEVLQHGVLFDNYPSLASIGIVWRSDLPDRVLGGYSHAENAFHLNGNRTLQEIRSTLLHELQHAVQVIEGFARGGSPHDEAFMSAVAAMGVDVNDRDAVIDAYERLLGEVEARDVQARAELTAKELRERPPYVSQGIPESDFIVRREGEFAAEERPLGDTPSDSPFLRGRAGQKPGTAGLSASGLREALAGRFGAGVGRLIEAKTLRIVQHESELPPHLNDGKGGIRGVYDPTGDPLTGEGANTTWMVADNLTAADAPGVFLHELGVHYGLERMVGSEKYQDIIRQMKAMEALGNEAVRAARAAIPKGTTKAAVDDELLAYLVEKHRELPIVKRLIAAIRAFLFRMGLIKNVRPEDVVALAKAAARHAARTPSYLPLRKGEDLLSPLPLRKGEDLLSPLPLQKGELEGVSPAYSGSGFDLTPELRASAMRGLPLFSRQDEPNGQEPGFYEVQDEQGRLELVRQAMEEIAAGKAEGVARGLRADLSQYGGDADVHFPWGDLKHGIYHIGSQRGLDVLGRVLRAVALGAQVQYVAAKKTVRITHEGTVAVLSLDEHGKRKTWLLTGWEEGKPDARAEVSTRIAATQPGPTFSRAELGADFLDTIAASGGPVKGPQAPLFSRVSPPEPPPDLPRSEQGRRAPDPNTPEGAAAALGRIGEAMRTTRHGWEAVKSKVVNDWRPARLALATRRQLVDIGQGMVPELADYDRAVQAMDADRNQLDGETHEVAEIAETYVQAHPKEADDFFDLLHSATLAGTDPAETFRPSINRGEAFREMASLRRRMRTRPGEADVLQGQIDEIQVRLDNEKVRKGAHPGLAKRYAALSQDAKDVYAKMRDLYMKRFDEREAALIQAIRDAEADDRWKQRLIKDIQHRFETARLSAPYFPLTRFGDFWISATNPDGEREFHLRESAHQMKALTEDLARAGYHDIASGRKIDKLFEQQGASAGFVTEVIKLLDRGTHISHGARADLKDAIYQMYLQSLPELSTRRHWIHRKKTPGFSKDAVRGFAKHMFHGNRQLAVLRQQTPMAKALADAQKREKYGFDPAHEPMEQALRDMQRNVKDKADPKLVALEKALAAARKSVKDGLDPVRTADLINEMQKRDKWIKNPQVSSFAYRAGSLGFLWYLTAPASAIVNVTQTPLVAYPLLAARHGWVQSAAALNRAAVDFFKGRFSVEGALQGEELAAYNRFIGDAVIDKTQTHDLAGMAETPSGSYSGRGAKAMRAASFMFHRAEVMNREITALAAYRLARAAGVGIEAAYQQAKTLTFESHFDYSTGNKPRFLQNDAARVFLMFKQFSQHMLYLLGRSAHQSIKGLTPAARSEARTRLSGLLGMHALFAGALGMPLMGTLATIMNALFDDEDEPWDFETEFRNFLAEAFGPEVGQAIARGPVESLTGLGIASRVGLSDLVFREPDKSLEGRGLVEWWSEQILGPLGGIALKAGTAYDLFQDGEVWRGLESMTPTAIRSGLQSLRYYQEGAQSLRGDAVMEDVSMWNVVAQGAGFSPAELGQKYDANRALKDLEQRILDRRERLIGRWWLARRHGDIEGVREAMAEIGRFNGSSNIRENPRARITPATLLASMQSRRNYSRRAEGGVIVDRRLSRLEERVSFGG